jgi:hypothetical protein
MDTSQRPKTSSEAVLIAFRDSLRDVLFARLQGVATHE